MAGKFRSGKQNGTTSPSISRIRFRPVLVCFSRSGLFQLISAKIKDSIGMNLVQIKLNLNLQNRDGNGSGRGWRMGSSSPPRMVLSCPIPALLRMMGKTFSPYPYPLGPRETPPYPVKLYFLLIFPTTNTVFFNETYFINKNILTITTKFIPLNQINF